MSPSCLPLLFNAKVLAKDTFLLLLHYSILLCTVGQLLALVLGTGLAGLAWLLGLRPRGSRNIRLLGFLHGSC